jgi:hypothetical protein
MGVRPFPKTTLAIGPCPKSVALAREQGVLLLIVARQILDDFPEQAISLEKLARE